MTALNAAVKQGMERGDSDVSSERGGTLFSDSNASQSNSEACSDQVSWSTIP